MDQLKRAQGCLLGQLAGDALGSQLEFMCPKEIIERYPSGVRDLTGGGPWETLPGQPTDGSEMALALARSIVAQGGFDKAAVLHAYLMQWASLLRFDLQTNISRGRSRSPDRGSEESGALKRISPLGIAGVRMPVEHLRMCAMQDAAITHSHPNCGQICAIFVQAIATAIERPWTPEALYAEMCMWSSDKAFDPVIRKILDRATLAPPRSYLNHPKWGRTAFHNAIWQLLNAESAEAGIIDTVARGGDTDANAAVAGALLGAVHGRASLPKRWIDVLRNCRPEASNPDVRYPRPKCYWPCNAVRLAGRLLAV